MSVPGPPWQWKSHHKCLGMPLSEWIGEILKYSKATCDKMQAGTLKAAHTPTFLPGHTALHIK